MPLGVHGKSFSGPMVILRVVSRVLGHYECGLIFSLMVIEQCPLCSAELDMSGFSPLQEVVCPSCGVPIWARSLWNHFEILDTLGEGGMGKVYLAKDKYLKRNVALKVLRLNEGNTKDNLSLEARTTASIEHPSIVQIFDFGESQGEFYIAMELIPGGSLHDRMHREQGVSEGEALRVGIDVAEGLEAALAKGLIHRDIKPANILFMGDGRAKLVDFGLATAMGNASAGDNEAVLGTPYYIAPERLDDRSEDFRSDIYSLGASLMHAISRVPPLDEEWPDFAKLQRLKGEQLDLAKIAPQTSADVVTVLNRMVAPEPGERYASYRELLAHLRAASEGRPLPKDAAGQASVARSIFKKWIPKRESRLAL